MALFLITGLGGAGKSALVYELRRRGLSASDSDDIAGLTRWRDIRTGETLDGAPPQPVDFSRHRFAWQEEAMFDLFRAKGDFYLCGGAWNARRFYPCFEHIFVVTPARPQPRAKTAKPKRTSKREVPPPDPVPSVLGATALSGKRSIPEIADEVLAKIAEVKRPRSLRGLGALIRPRLVRWVMRLEARRGPPLDR